MACGSIDHQFVLKYLLVSFQTLRQIIDHDGVFIGILAVAAVALVLLFQWTQSVIVPPLAAYLENKLWKHAREWFNNSRLAFLGFTIRSCVISLLFAYVFYLLLKAFFRFPGYWEYSLSAIAISAIVFSLVGYEVCGKVKLRTAAKTTESILRPWAMR